MRRLLSALATAALALPLLAATGAPSEPTGTASTQMRVLELRVTGLAPIVAVDGATSATTVGAPLARTDAVALQVGDDEYAPARTRSDGQQEDETETISLDASDVGFAAVMNPVTARSTTATNRASASLAAATSSWVVDLSGLPGALQTRVDSANAASEVTDTAATADQGVSVSRLGLRLGGLVDALEQLPLATILALIEELDLPLTVDADAAIGAVTDAVAAAGSAADAVVAVGAQTATTIGELESAHAAASLVLPTVSALQSAHDQLTALDPLSLTLADDIRAILTDPEIAACGIADLDVAIVLDGATAVIGQLVDCVADQLQAAVTPHLADPGSFDPATALDDLSTAIAAIAAAADALVAPGGPLGTAIDDLEAAVLALTTVLDTGDLADLVDEVIALLDTLDGTSLLSVEQLDVSVTAIAGPDAGATSASIGCAVELTVLRTTVGPQTCEGGLDAVIAAADTLNAAIVQVRDVLATLPGADLADLGELELRVLSDATDPTVCPGGASYVRTCEVDGTLHATAGLRALDLTVPALTIDPSSAEDLLADLLADLAALDPGTAVSDALAAVAAALSGTPFAGADSALQTAGTTAAGAVDTAAGAAQDAVDAVAAVLDASSIGDLVGPVTTPRIEVGLDPVSTASFTPVAAAPATPPTTSAPDPAPDPAPEPTPDLPSTGGGAVLLALLSLGGAYTLRRRRD